MRVAIFFVWFLGVVIGVPALFVAGRLARGRDARGGGAARRSPTASRRVALSGIVDAAGERCDRRRSPARVRRPRWRCGRRHAARAGGRGRRVRRRRRANTDLSECACRAHDLLVDLRERRVPNAGRWAHGRLVVADGTVVIVAGPSDDAVNASLCSLRARVIDPALAGAVGAGRRCDGPFLLRTLGPWAALGAARGAVVRTHGELGGRESAVSGVPVDAATLPQPARARRWRAAVHGHAGHARRRADRRLALRDTRLDAGAAAHGTPSRTASCARRRAPRGARAGPSQQRSNWSAGGADQCGVARLAREPTHHLFQYEHETGLGIGIENGRFAITPEGVVHLRPAQAEGRRWSRPSRSGWEWRPVIARLLGV